ncbi:MAG TPA: hypothetical protein VM432_07835 [Bdellovibrionales bacterium]|jgi:hypothetical protein|nr:hypothetical protein [Bdellovibrionales bacterium]
MFTRSKRNKLRKGQTASGVEYFFHRRPLKPRLVAEESDANSGTEKVEPKKSPVPTRTVREKARASDRAVKLGKLKT